MAGESEIGLPVPLTQLPRIVLIGRTARVEVTSLDGESLQLAQNQSLLRGDSEVLCAGSSDGRSETLTTEIQAPVLLDLTEKSTVGSSVWVFHSEVLPDKVLSWNKASRILSASFDSRFFQQKNRDTQVFQLNEKQFLIQYNTVSKGTRQKVSVIYDSAESN
jgi:hypothetical protein